MKTIYVVAHAESVHHVEQKVGGWYDTGLTEKGQEQAKAVSKRLKEIIEDGGMPLITSSDLLRAKQTAQVIGTEFNCEVRTTPDLREMSQGSAEGKPQKWLDDRITVAPDDNRLDHVAIENGESKRDFISRIYRAVDEVVNHDASTHVVVTHGFALTFVVARWIGMPIESAGFVNFRSSSGGITHLHQDEFWNNRSVISLNDTTHLTF